MEGKTSKKICSRSPNAKFFVRFRPTKVSCDYRHLIVDQNMKTLFVRAIQDLERPVPKWTYWQFNTDGVLRGETAQEVVYSTVLSSNLALAFKGVDLVVIAFGEPGTGKTYTLSGLNKTYAERGIIPRALADLFLTREWNTEIVVEMSVSYVEFSENKCHNLLGRKRTEVASNKIKPVKVNHLEEACDLLFHGEPRRKFEKVSSNCSTAVYTVHITSTSLNQLDPIVMLSKVHFIDTPGIECFWKLEKSTPCAISSNLDKFSVDCSSRWAYYFAQRIDTPSKQGKTPAVYGTSSLVKYLNRSFTHGLVTLIGFIDPAECQLRWTLSTLRFGCKVARLHCGLLERHKRPLTSGLTNKLAAEIDELRAQIEYGKLIKLGEYNHSNVCQGEAQHVERLVRSYLKSSFADRVTETCMFSTASPTLLFEEIKRQYHAEEKYITSRYPLKMSFRSELQSISEIATDFEKARRGHKKKRRSNNSAMLNLPDPSQLIGVAEEVKSLERKSIKSRKSTSGMKSKSAGSRKSMAPRKSKVEASKRKGTKGSSSGTKAEEFPQIDEAFLEKGLKDKVWLLNEFLLRNKSLAEAKKSAHTVNCAAREAKVSKCKELDELRASLGRTRTFLTDAQWRRNYTSFAPTATSEPNEDEKALMEKEKDICGKISKAIEEIVVLQGVFNESTVTHEAFHDRLNKDFQRWCHELYQNEKLDEELFHLRASMFDQEIPRSNVLRNEEEFLLRNTLPQQSANISAIKLT